MNSNDLKMYSIHPLADVQTENIGNDTRIWQFSVVLKGAVIGSNCNICSHCFIENNVVIGNNVTLKFYVELCDGVTLEDDVFVAPHVSFTNDSNPRSKKILRNPEKTLVKKGASIGANVVIVPGVTIGEYAFIAPGAVVNKDVPPFTFWAGVPAKQKGFVTKDCIVLDMNLTSRKTGDIYKLTSDGPELDI
jgi:acetyltransferase-like isoleucine patch superfamily enzyme